MYKTLLSRDNDDADDDNHDDDDDDDDDDYDDSDDLKLFSPCFLDLQICRTDRNPDL